MSKEICYLSPFGGLFKLSINNGNTLQEVLWMELRGGLKNEVLLVMNRGYVSTFQNSYTRLRIHINVGNDIIYK